ncbi:hypothetical protein [Pedomonas mirosovicensis]|uniref:hypothetical protein n=1 Tax=Pedomonas mirosovicensis TaxID=2908641 RepID=UPI00216A9D1B|nr:hypothetical protein [Pedomonas mirosovicensis]MCH8686700.1 hypothetical protein [Pedomonas mirosovicensis]
MADRCFGQEQLGFAVRAKAVSFLDALSGFVDWTPIKAQLFAIHARAKGEAA